MISAPFLRRERIPVVAKMERISWSLFDYMFLPFLFIFTHFFPSLQSHFILSSHYPISKILVSFSLFFFLLPFRGIFKYCYTSPKPIPLIHKSLPHHVEFKASETLDLDSRFCGTYTAMLCYTLVPAIWELTVYIDNMKWSAFAG